jgi:large subunit ribosomal protein L3
MRISQIDAMQPLIHFFSMSGIITKKVEMTRLLKNDAFVPVTLLKFPETTVEQVKTIQKDGYEAIVLKSSFGKQVYLREVPATGAMSGISVGTVVTLDMLEGVTTVVLTGVSKGKGFAGAMKRHNFSGGCASHGSKFHRALGSIGTRKPRRTKPGQKMHGHMGTDTVTLKDIAIELVNKELGIVAVRGPVPGARNSLVVINF